MAKSLASNSEVELQHALAEVGLETEIHPSPGPSHRADLVVRSKHGVRFHVEVIHRALVSERDVEALLRSKLGRDRRKSTVGVVVADRVTEDAKRQLRDRGWGWLDLRGHLHMEAPGVFVDARVTPVPKSLTTGKNPLAGHVGLELACLLLMRPSHGFGVREAASYLDHAASSVSEEMSRLRDSGLVDRAHKPAIPELFRVVVGRWHSESIDVASLPDLGDGPMIQALRLGLDDPESTTGWALGDTLAAMAYGAPLNVSTNYPPDLYVPGHTTLRRAARLLGTSTTRMERTATLRTAPVSIMCAKRVVWHTGTTSPWPLVHPLFVALDLAQDPGRGSEVLAAWNPPERWQRVW